MAENEIGSFKIQPKADVKELIRFCSGHNGAFI